jgi:hypothetical protein
VLNHIRGASVQVKTMIGCNRSERHCRKLGRRRGIAAIVRLNEALSQGLLLRLSRLRANAQRFLAVPHARASVRRRRHNVLPIGSEANLHIRNG